MQSDRVLPALILTASFVPAQMVIDWSTYLGGVDDDTAYAVAVDPVTAHIIVVGDTISPGFPFTNGAYQGPDKDVYVARFDPSRGGGAQLLWCTRIGGNGYDTVYPASVAIGPGGQIAVVGQTGSTNLVTTTNAYDRTWNGGSANPGVDSDAFVAVLDAGGSITYLSYFGGQGGQYGDYATAAAWDRHGRIVMAGFTESATGFPVTASAVSPGSQGDGWFAVLDPMLGSGGLTYSSRFGALGYNDGSIRGVAVDANDIVTIAGSSNAPIAAVSGFANGYDTSFDGPYDAYLARIDTKVSGPAGLLYATYVGGSSDDLLNGMYVDSAGVVTIVGQTSSTNFPTTPDAVRTAPANNNGFLCRIDPARSGANSLRYATLLGGNGYDPIQSVVPRGVSEDRLMVVQTTGSDNLATPYASQRMRAGSHDLLLSYFDFTSPAPRIASRYFGGSQNDFFYGAAAHPDGRLTVVGRTHSSNIPTSNNAFAAAQPTTGAVPGKQDAIAVTFDVGAIPYGSGVNPPQSLTTLAGAPRLGSFWTLGVNDPTNAMPGAAFALVAIAGSRGAVSPVPVTGDFLLDSASTMWLSFAPWSSNGAATTVALPPNPVFHGTQLFVQAAIVDAASSVMMTVALDVML